MELVMDYIAYNMINIDKLIQQSIKLKERVKLKAYKNLKAEIQTLKTAKNAKPYDEVAEVQLISKMCKKLEDSISEFSKAGRGDLVLEYREELEELRKFLPEPVNESQIYSTLEDWIKNNISNHISEFRNYYPSEEHKLFIPKKEMGKAIKYLKNKFPQADGKIISDIVKKYMING